MKVTAAVSREPGNRLSLEQLELDQPRPNEVLVRIAGTGICHTDHSVMHQHFWPPIPQPMVLGHEGSGIVEAVGSGVTGLAVGDPVVMTINGCGNCSSCRAGLPSYCSHAFEMNFHRIRRDGSATLHDAHGPVGGCFFGQSSFATYSIANATNTVRIGTDLPIERMGPLGCGLQTGAGAVFNTLKARPGQSLAVFGTGTVGLAAVMAARVTGCDPIIAVDTRGERLEMARELGATHCIVGGSGDLTQQLRDCADGTIDAAIDTTAVPQVFAAGIEALRMGGTIVLLGAPAGDVTVTIPMNSILIGRVIRGAIQGDAEPHSFIPMLASLHKAGEFPFDKFVTYYPFEEIDQAIHDTSVTGKTIKAVMLMPGFTG